MTLGASGWEQRLDTAAGGASAQPTPRARTLNGRGPAAAPQLLDRYRYLTDQRVKLPTCGDPTRRLDAKHDLH